MLDALKLIEHAVTEPNQEKEYILMTLHRPYNVDDFDRLHLILKSVAALEQRIIFPLHPRTRAVLKEKQVLNAYDNISFIEPIGYIQNMSYLTHASGLITDSGGMQKEAYFLKKKCIHFFLFYYLRGYIFIILQLLNLTLTYANFLSGQEQLIFFGKLLMIIKI